MDKRLLEAIEKAKNKMSREDEKKNHDHLFSIKREAEPIIRLDDGYMFDLPLDFNKPPQHHGKQKKPVVDMIETIMAKPAFDLQKVHEELMREYEELGEVPFEEEENNNLGLI